MSAANKLDGCVLIAKYIQSLCSRLCVFTKKNLIYHWSMPQWAYWNVGHNEIQFMFIDGLHEFYFSHLPVSHCFYDWAFANIRGMKRFKLMTADSDWKLRMNIKAFYGRFAILHMHSEVHIGNSKLMMITESILFPRSTNDNLMSIYILLRRKQFWREGGNDSYL